MPAARSHVAVIALLGLAACRGAIEDASDPAAPVVASPVAPPRTPAPPDKVTPPSAGTPTPPGAGPSPGPAVCGSGVARPGERMRRLTLAEHRNTLRDLFAVTWRDGKATDAVMAAAEPAFAQLPADERARSLRDPNGSYRRMDQDVAQIHVDGAYDIALLAADAATTPERLGLLLGPCATNATADDDDACLGAFIESFGARALRRPLSPDEVMRYRRVYAAGARLDAEGVADVVAAFLMAPAFLYHVEHGGADVPGLPDVRTLTSFELASRLSYHFWQSMPDDELFAAARSGALDTADGLAKQVDRLFASTRTRATVDELFYDWLKLADQPILDPGAKGKDFQAFVGALTLSWKLRPAVTDEVLDLVRHHVWTTPGTFSDLLTTELSFAKGAELPALYGIVAWDGKSEPPRFPPGERPGLLTRTALLASGTVRSRPIMKGVFIRHNLLCDDIPPPPDNAAQVQPEPGQKTTTRKTVEGITEAPGTACAGCHKTLINPLGFVTEGFDSLGRRRTQETVFDADGKVLGTAPVDTRVVPQVVFGDTREATTPAELVRQIVDSGKAQACMARQYFRFTFARYEDDAADACTLDKLRRAFAGDAAATSTPTLAGALRAIALMPEFSQRSFH